MRDLVVSLVQTGLFWEDKPSNLQLLGEKISGIREKTELVILPEMFSTGFSMNPAMLAEAMDGPTMQWMRRMAAEKKCILTGSIIARETRGSETHFYNRLIWMLPDGHYGYYDKRHLFAYGREHQHYTAGKSRLIASAKGWKINLQVCYDLRFPVWLRQSNPAQPISAGKKNEPEYDILIFVANWPSARSHAWKTLLQARAIENQCFVIGVNRTGTDGNGLTYTGDSLVAGPLGEILNPLSGNEEIITMTLHKEMLGSVRSQFPFLEDANHFLIQS
ncbi:MAG: nitrilase family protein [Chitinophagales bacterium]